MLDNIGNLLVISFRTNSQLNNKLPEEKIQLLKSDPGILNLQYLQSFIAEYEQAANNWNDQTIEQRAIDLAKYCYKNVWVF
jgi:hypothetical protein